MGKYPLRGPLKKCTIREVEKFTHRILRKHHRKNGGTEADMGARIGKAKMTLTHRQKVWKASDGAVKTKIRLFILFKRENGPDVWVRDMGKHQDRC